VTVPPSRERIAALEARVRRCQAQQAKHERLRLAAERLCTWIAEVPIESHVERVGELYELAEVVEAALRLCAGDEERG
jgi:hypothetical protein